MIRLFVNYYKDSNVERQHEIELCIQNNRAFIPNIVNVGDEYLDNAKNVPFKSRPTFSDFFDVINTIASDDDISIIANLDIQFDDTISLVDKIEKNQVFALTRYEDGVHFGRVDSQDVWVFRGKVKDIEADFGLGIGGCDNKILYLLDKQYEVLNPSLDIHCHHIHKSGVRNYIKNGVVERVKPPYKTIKACGLTK